MMDYKHYEQQAIIRAWKDPHYKKKLLSHPEEALKEIGCPIPKGGHARVIEAKEREWTFVLPMPPTGGKTLSETELRNAAGGTGCTWSGDIH